MFSRQDYLMAKGLKAILDSGTFPLQAKEVPAFSSIYSWVAGLEPRFKRYIEENKMTPIEPDKPTKRTIKTIKRPTSIPRAKIKKAVKELKKDKEK